MANSGERAWVEMVKSDLQAAIRKKNIIVETGHRLPYSLFVSTYEGEEGHLIPCVPNTKSYGYQTDLLVAERLSRTKWVPRVIVEFKLGSITTHDALTYSAKAATHKNVHPYLRYGIVIGCYKGPVPQRLIRHGQHFDFMVTLESEKLTEIDRERLVRLLRKEIEAARTLEALASEKSDVWLLHRRLEVAR